MRWDASRTWWVSFESARVSLTFFDFFYFYFLWLWPKDESRLHSGLVGCLFMEKFQIAKFG